MNSNDINTNTNSNLNKENIKSEQLKAKNPSTELDIFSNNTLDIKDDFLEPNEDIQFFPKENESNNSTFISKVYYSSYNNINGQSHKECYQSQLMQQKKDGHEISEAQENYKNSNGVMKSAHQKILDKRGERIIKEKNGKNGKIKQHKIFKDLKENQSQEFNNKFEDYSSQSGFKEYFGNHCLNRKTLRN